MNARSSVAAIFILATITGCTSLLVREQDSAGATAGKVAARTILGITTLGISEISLSLDKQELEDETYLEAYHAHLVELANQGKLTMAEAERMAVQERARREDLAFQRRADTAAIIQQGFSRAGQSFQRNRMRCTSEHLGSTTFTDCY